MKRHKQIASRPAPGNSTIAPAPEPPPLHEPVPDPNDQLGHLICVLRNPLHEPVPDPNDQLGHLICVLRDQLRRADSFATSAEKELMESWGTGGDDSGQDEDEDEDQDQDQDDSIHRRRNRVEDLVEAAKLEVRAAKYTIEQLDAQRAAQRRNAQRAAQRRNV